MMNEEIKKTTEEIEDIMAGGIIRLGGEYKKLEIENERLRADLKVLIEEKQDMFKLLKSVDTNRDKLRAELKDKTEIVVLLQTQLAEKDGECAWVYDEEINCYGTDCGGENGVKFCMYCGKKIIQKGGE